MIFFQGKYQEDLEKSLSDQMLWGQSIKTAMTSGKSEIIENGKKLVANIERQKNHQQKSSQKIKPENSKEEEKPKEVRKIKYMPYFRWKCISLWRFTLHGIQM